MRTRGINTFAISIALLIGLTLGSLIGGGLVYFYKTRPFKPRANLHVLAQAQPIPKSILDRYLQSDKVLVQQDVAHSNNELLEKLNDRSHDYDLVVLLSWQVPTFIESQLLSPLKKSLLSNARFISADFKQMPHDKDLVYSVPVAWGVNGMVINGKRISTKPTSWIVALDDKSLEGKIALLPDPRELMAGLIRRHSATAQDVEGSPGSGLLSAFEKILPYARWTAKKIVKGLGQGDIIIGELSNGYASILSNHSDDFKFVVPDESATLWTMSISPCRGSNNEKQAHRFIDYLLKKETALELTSNHQLASPLVSVEYEPISAMLKPSYLRTLPLNRLQIVEPVSQMAKQWETTVLNKTSQVN